jgi:hypothetical protein
LTCAVKPTHRTESRLRSVAEGTEVAFVNPEAAKPKTASTASARPECGSVARRGVPVRQRRRIEIWPELGYGLDNLRAHKLRSSSRCWA